MAMQIVSDMILYSCNTIILRFYLILPVFATYSIQRAATSVQLQIL